MPTSFTLANVCRDRIVCDTADLLYCPPAWMQQGLQETATGYGSRLNSGYKIHFEGRLRRVYATCYGNAASLWFNYQGSKIFIG